jgi:hypothetical protein
MLDECGIDPRLRTRMYAQVMGRGVDPIGHPQRIDDALSNVRGSLVDVTSSRSTLHGWRAQALFEAIVASLGRVRLLKLEDSGDIYFEGDSLKPPDFRIVTLDGEQILVEVKKLSSEAANKAIPNTPQRPRRVTALRKPCRYQLVEVRNILEPVEPLVTHRFESIQTRQP